jgi:Leucine-rich repeat (LRR) protein
LVKLWLWGNGFNDISALASLENLAELHFGGNQVTDISALIENAGLGDGDEINMQNNNLDLTTGSQNMNDINTLIARGCEVTYQPQN